jgi:hypothetical protein
MKVTAHQAETGTRERAMRDAFFAWQCRVRQMAMRKKEGWPDKSIAPSLTLPGAAEALGDIVTVLNKAPSFSVTPEMQHMVRQTHDPAQRREKAIQFFSATYYQKPYEFAEVLTSTFSPGSKAAEAICRAGGCALDFEAFGQKFSLQCACSSLDGSDPIYQATWWHNVLFNPGLPPDTVVLGFVPDWARSKAVPDISANHSGR